MNVVDSARRGPLLRFARRERARAAKQPAASGQTRLLSARLAGSAGHGVLAGLAGLAGRAGLSGRAGLAGLDGRAGLAGLLQICTGNFLGTNLTAQRMYEISNVTNKTI